MDERKDLLTIHPLVIEAEDGRYLQVRIPDGATHYWDNTDVNKGLKFYKVDTASGRRYIWGIDTTSGNPHWIDIGLNADRRLGHPLSPLT